MKTLIAIPCMDYLEADFVECLTNLTARYSPEEVEIKYLKASLVYDARNQLTQYVLKKGGYDYVLWLDSDMIFKPDTMVRLLEHNAPIVSGAYFRRSPPYHLVAFDKCDAETREWTDLPLPTETVKCGGVGFGCVLVRTDVLFEVAAKYKTWFEPMNGFGEDLSFCWRARECGFDILLDPSITCGHVGHIVVNEDFYKAYANGGTT
jgi:GT2 family glycosyltransferase